MPQGDQPPTLFGGASSEPLAARMRPRTLDEYIGQDQIVGPGRLLRRAIEADQLSSLIFYGPPGTGKTTLARVIANSTMARFTTINAVLGGVKDIREAVTQAQTARRAGVRTLLFVDEVHRFNKAQQDALLPWVENGTVILIGATTENPYFEVNKALVSRSRIFQLSPLTAEDLRKVAAQALSDAERGYGSRPVDVDDDALEHLVNVANGDARALLNALELAVETTPLNAARRIRVTREVAEESIQQRAVLYDKEGDAHFDTISAFIKSVRGSDPDAALYWLAKMVYAGEDPRFILRRLLILASEDVGLADPQALPHTVAAAQAFEHVGMPEGRYHLAQATLYLATAPKSNTTMGFFDALSVVRREREAEVPNHLKDASRDAEGFGHGAGYAYPHAYRDHWVAQQYLPEQLQGKVFYVPSGVGYEAQIAEGVARKREAQLEAMLHAPAGASWDLAPAPGSPKGTPGGRQRDSWLERATSEVGERLAKQRNAVIATADLQRHHVVLDVSGGGGLLTWEALRRTPEGQVWTLEPSPGKARALAERAKALEELQRPVIVQQPLATITPSVFGEVRFDAVIGLNTLAASPDAALELLKRIFAVTAPTGVVALAEPDVRRAQRLYALLDLPGTDSLAERLAEAEEAIYGEGENSLPLGLSGAALEELAVDVGFGRATITRGTVDSRVRVSAGTITDWFAAGSEKPSYAELLAGKLSPDDLEEVKRLFVTHLSEREVVWRSPFQVLWAAR